MANQINNKSEPINDLINIGSEIAGGATGAAVGFLAAGPTGAVLGGATAPLLTHTFRNLAAEIKRRLLSPREEVRIGATITFAINKIKENIASGQQIRQDSFFQKQLDERAASEEILESILLVAQREPQERKLQFYGNLIANIAFHSEIDKAEANLLISLCERMSYRQICLLSLFAQKERFDLRQENYRNVRNIGGSRVVLLQEIYDLYSQGMLNASGKVLLGLGDIKPAKINVQGTGGMLYELMELWKVDLQDLNKIVMLLR